MPTARRSIAAVTAADSAQRATALICVWTPWTGSIGRAFDLEAFGERPSKTTLATLVTEDDPAQAKTERARVVAPTTAGSDDALWFASQGAVGRVALDGGIQMLPTTTEGGAPNWYGIAEGGRAPERQLSRTGNGHGGRDRPRSRVGDPLERDVSGPTCSWRATPVASRVRA
jgi:hypothetical protein